MLLLLGVIPDWRKRNEKSGMRFSRPRKRKKISTLALRTLLGEWVVSENTRDNMESSSDCEIVSVVKNTPPINQRMGTFTITLPYYVLERGTQNVPFKVSPSNVIQTMSTGTWDIMSLKGVTPVKLIIYPGLERGTFSAGWKKFLKMNKFKGGDIVAFVVPEQLISEGKNGFLWAVKEGSVELADLFA